MINYQELFEILKCNNINSASPEETVSEALNHLSYSPAEQQEVLGFLKSQGWMSGGNNASGLPETAVAASPMAATMPVAAEPAPLTIQPQPIISNEPFNAAVRPMGLNEPVAETGRPVKSGNGDIKKIVAINLVILVILIAAGLIYAFIQKIGPFAFSKYTEANFFSGILAKTNEIRSASYTISGELAVGARDEGAKPFSVKEASNAAELRKKYENDSVRIDDVSSIIRTLNYASDYSSYYDSEAGDAVTAYPESIATLFQGGDNSYHSYGSNSVKDPATGKAYEYKATEGGTNFALIVTFETDYAIQAISDYDSGYDEEESQEKASDTIIAGKKVTFTRDSPSYIYMSSEPPKPFFVALSESMRTFPADIDIKASVSASSETKSSSESDWLFNVNAEGDFSDLTYKINADALKKDDTYYLKINNFPSIFLTGDVALAKGKWVSITPAAATEEDEDEDEYSFSLLSILEENLLEMEKSFKENREKSVKFTKKMIAVADEVNLVAFKTKPRTEKVDGRDLVRYELSLRRDSILPFYTRLQEEIDKNPDFEDYRGTIDQGLIDYLKSDEFKEVFAYFDENNSFVIWTDILGFPALVQNTMRIVPPDTATQLKGKQINIVFKSAIDKINEELNIQAPSGAVPIDDLIDDYNNNLDSSKLDDAPDESAITIMARNMQANISSFFGNSEFLTLKNLPEPGRFF